jgi:threonylcarbamoyladenosine tRNA methylthiotransferase MtaB
MMVSIHKLLIAIQMCMLRIDTVLQYNVTMSNASTPTINAVIDKQAIARPAIEPVVLPPDKTRTVAFYTLGCKTNQLETSTVASQFQQLGWDVVAFEDAADVYVINTCTVTSRSDLESQRMIRRARLTNPNGKIAVTGCYTQMAPQEVASLSGVQFVIGNNFKDELAQVVHQAMLEETAADIKNSGEAAVRPVLVKVSDIDKSRVLAGASASAPDRTRGSLKIQDGCDYKCTYCIIWEARGKSRSLPAADLVVQLQRLIEEGFKEVVLTGINIGQYDDGHHHLTNLLALLIEVPGDYRLRLSSLDPMEVTPALIDVVANSSGKLCPYFHLSAQTANDEILKKMARRHHVQQMLDVCELIHNKLPNACIGSDIIVGFPGETAAHFESTVEALHRAAMQYFHVFSYSKRDGTPAASMAQQVPERDKKERAKRLRCLSEEKMQQYVQHHIIGQTVRVLVESDGLGGLSENYLRVQLVSSDTETVDNTPVLPPNEWVQARISRLVSTDTLRTTVEGVVS